MKTCAWVTLAVSVAVAPRVRAQDGSTSPTAPKPRVETSVSLGVGAQLTATRVFPSYPDLGAQSFDPSATVLGSLRQNVRPWLGYSLNLGYTRTTQENVGSSSLYGGAPFPVPTNVYEVSVAYLVEKHWTPNLVGFANVGAGVLSFLPGQTGRSTSSSVPVYLQGQAKTYQSRPLGVAAVGFDFRLRPRLMLRAEYRGLLYKFPDHDNTFGRATTETSQPTLSLVYRFGAKP